MNVLVTGGSGFIGSHIVDKLITEGYDVTVLDHRVRPHRDEVEFVDVDLLDLQSMIQATRGFDYIFHLAAVSNVNYAYDHPVYTIKLNNVGTANVLEGAKQNGVKRVIFASTVWVYTGSDGQEVDESSPFYMPGAGHIYSSSKISSEFYINDYQILYGLPFTILRYGIPYGPRMREELLIPIFLGKAFSGEPLTIQGDGSQFRNFVYVEDLAEANVLSLSDSAKNEIINLDGKRKVTIKEVADTIKKLLGDFVKIDYISARPGDYGGKEVSNRKGKRLLGWEPTTDFEEGLKKTIQWYVKTHNISADKVPPFIKQPNEKNNEV